MAASKRSKDSFESSLSAEKGQDETDKAEKNFDSDIRELFRLFDTDNNRSISADELGKAMLFLGMSPTDEEVFTAMRELDVNGNGRIEFQEFYNFMHAEMTKISEGSFPNKEEVIRTAFRTFDKEGEGFIEANQLRTVMKTLGECLTDREIEDMMKQAKVDDEGKINYEEFVRIWCETT